jgi:hypothetical protein
MSLWTEVGRRGPHPLPRSELFQVSPCLDFGVAGHAERFGVADIFEPCIGQHAGRARVVLKHLGQDRVALLGYWVQMRPVK